MAFAALPFALSILVTVPAIVLAFGTDWFRTGGSDDGAGRVVVLSIGPRVRALVARAARPRPAHDVRAPWRGVVGALALASVLVAALAVLPVVL